MQTDKLPEGKTCADCFHWKRCYFLFGDINELTREETYCDWDASRFKEKLIVSPMKIDTIKIVGDQKGDEFWS